MRKTMSLKQIAANRQNARKSTGPKTPAGRAVSSMNALKHGILSKEVLVRGLHRKESGHELAALHQRFWEDLNPVGVTEEMLVDQIVTAHWRLRRALTAESGEIALSVDEGHWKRSRGPHPTLQWSQWEAFGDPIPNMLDCSIGNSILETWLGEVRKVVEQEGELTAVAVQNLVEHFGGKPNGLTRELEKLRLKLQANPEALVATALREKHKLEILGYLDRKIRDFFWWRKRCVGREENAEKAQQAAAVLPPVAVLEKIQRYETKLERQMYRAMTQLERLQRMRRGEEVPAPVSVEVSERA